MCGFGDGLAFRSSPPSSGQGVVGALPDIATAAHVLELLPLLRLAVPSSFRTCTSPLCRPATKHLSAALAGKRLSEAISIGHHLLAAVPCMQASMSTVSIPNGWKWTAS